MNYSYLSPPSKIKHIKLPKNYVYEVVDGKHKRRIFGRGPYEQFEQEHINKLKDYLHKKSPYVSYPDELLLRFSYAGNFLLSQATEKVKQYEEWHQNQIITNLQKAGREILEYGHVYAFGRDYEYCPVIIVRAAQIDLHRYSTEDYFSALANLLRPIETYMLVPGIIEKWNVLVDFEYKKCGPTVNQLLTRSFVRIAAAYPYRLKRMLFLNSDSRHLQIKTQITNFLTTQGSQAEVKQVVSWFELQQVIPHDEREKKYQGALANLCEFWPIHTTNKYEESQSGLDSESDYKTVMNDAAYFEVQRPFCDCSHLKCHIY